MRFKILKVHRKYAVHAPYMHCTKLLINKFIKKYSDEQNIFTYSCTSLYSACTVLCTVHVWCIKKKILHLWCLFGACTVLVQCIHDQGYSKEEQQTRSPIANSNGCGLVL